MLLGTCLAAPAAAGQPTGADAISPDIDPLQCWWRTSAPMVRVGEPLSVVLTCAVVDSPAVTVVADEGRLAPEAISLAPFELIDGSRAADLRTADRRFFQFHYRLRLVSDAFFGSDVSVPATTISYRTQSRTSDGTMLEGFERSYELPPLSVRILSLVPPEATDIREVPPVRFGDLDAAWFRARTLTTAGGALMLVGSVLLAMALGTRLMRAPVKAPADSLLLSDRVLLKRLRREFQSIRDERESGWSAALATRTLAALRIAGGYVLKQPPSQRAAPASTPVEGALLCRAGVTWVAVSSDVTPETVERARRLLSKPDRGHHAETSERLETLATLHQALTVLTHTRYGAPAALPEELLDRAVATGAALTRSLIRADARLTRLFAAASARAAMFSPRAWRA